MNLSKNNLKNLIETEYQDYLFNDDYRIKTINPSKLLTFKRFDLAFKLFYLEMIKWDLQFAKFFYKEHIRAFTFGKYKEPGKKEKNNIDKFIYDFNQTFQNIKINGFDNRKTLIPISKNNIILNGAHRVASALYLGKNVDCIEINAIEENYDYNFFYKRNVSNKILDNIATKFIEYAENVYLAFIWPTAKGNYKEVDNILCNLIYKKQINLNFNGAHNLLSQIYYRENWLGNINNNFKGLKAKLAECFKNYDAVKVFAFQAKNLDEVQNIKVKIRNLYNVGKHSIHITDTKDEALRLARLVFNVNSIHFLNYANPNKYLSTNIKINNFKKFINANNINKNDVLIDSSLVLSCYGLREAKDTDFFCTDNKKIKFHLDGINAHDEELKFYRESKLELIYNPKNYFYFNDLKFISFIQLYRMKKNRSEKKDIYDLKIMDSMINKDLFKHFSNKFKQQCYYFSTKSYSIFIRLLKFLKFYNILKKIYNYSGKNKFY